MSPRRGHRRATILPLRGEIRAFGPRPRNASRPSLRVPLPVIQYGATMRYWLVGLLATSVGGLTFGLAQPLAHAGGRIAIAAAVLATLTVIGLGLVLADGIEKALGDIGKGLLVGVLVAAGVGWLQAEIQSSVERTAKRQTLLLTLAVQHNLVGVSLRNEDLRGLFLGGKNLRGAELEGAQLQDAILTESQLGRANLEEAHAEGAVLLDAHLEGTQLSRVHAEGANLEAIHAQGAELFEGSFVDAFLSYAVLRGAGLRADFAGAELEWADLTGATAEEARFEGGAPRRRDAPRRATERSSLATGASAGCRPLGREPRKCRPHRCGSERCTLERREIQCSYAVASGVPTKAGAAPGV